MRDRIGPYHVVRQLGEGGMGVVYEARDERLNRPVAVKVLKDVGDVSSRDRLRREARVAARLSHPVICHVYEIGEAEGGELYLALEHLSGESLAARISRGPIPPTEAGTIVLALLTALDAIDAAGLVHRDLKPSNVFLTAHGPRLLDFGLARPVAPALGDETATITQQGVVMGTPQYMAPEVGRGFASDIRSDLFSLGVMLYEMLAGEPPFTGESSVDVLHSVFNDSPPALGGSDLVVALDRVVVRALQKKPEHRYQSPAEMAEAIREALKQSTGSTTGVVTARPVTRLIVLPFRMLRPDADLEFLSYSLADAVTCSLSGLESLVVRSSAAASQYVGAIPDLATLARQAEVDAVLTGTVLASGSQVRVSAQLTEAPGGTLLWSQTSQIGMGDLFALQDQLVQRLVESLAIPLSARERSLLRQDVPASASAYEYYLRANQLCYRDRQWAVARELYLQCVGIDPHYAPAWARLGRCCRLLGKYGQGDQARAFMREAEEAFGRALTLNPDLSLALTLSSSLDLDRGGVCTALERLLKRAAGRPADPDLFAGLVQVCRYGGLHHASVAAHQEAVRLDPTMQTTVAHTYLALGDAERTIEYDHDDPPYLTCYAHLLRGNRDQALTIAERARQAPNAQHLRLLFDAVAAILSDEPGAAKLNLSELSKYDVFSDPEGWFYWAACFALVDDADPAIDLINRAVGGAYGSVALLELPFFDRVRGREDFAVALAAVHGNREAALATYREAGGPRILGTKDE